MLCNWQTGCWWIFVFMCVLVNVIISIWGLIRRQLVELSLQLNFNTSGIVELRCWYMGTNYVEGWLLFALTLTSAVPACIKMMTSNMECGEVSREHGAECKRELLNLPVYPFHPVQRAFSITVLCLWGLLPLIQQLVLLDDAILHFFFHGYSFSSFGAYVYSIFYTSLVFLMYIYLI